MNLLAAVRRLARVGKVPAAMAAACGLDLGELVARGHAKARLAHAHARRALVREMVDLGWDRPRIVAAIVGELGESESSLGHDLTVIRLEKLGTGTARPVKRPKGPWAAGRDAALVERRAKVRALLAEGLTHQQIADRLGASQPVVSNDVRCIQAEDTANPPQ